MRPSRYRSVGAADLPPMPRKSTLLRPFASWTRSRVLAKAATPIAKQSKVLLELVRKGAATAFGRDHGIASVRSHRDFAARVPVRDYEALKPYFERTADGEADVLWPGRPAYLAKTSGTTSGAKYIPITRDSTPNHFGTARNALFNYYGRTGRGEWLDGKMIFLSGSPALDVRNGIRVGRLSGISNHMVPAWLKRDQLPSYATNCVDDWGDKVDAIVGETLGKDLRLISGIPPWVQMYFERLLEVSGRDTVLECFPNFSVFVYGGVNYEPYRPQLERLIGGRVASVETYPASEGFVAFQDGEPGDGLLLNVASGIYFEFVPLAEAHDERPSRLTLTEVELGRQYAVVLSSNAGLWGYSLGDTVEFVSLRPYRIRVAGRVEHFISAFGEHVIGQEVEHAMGEALRQNGGRVTEFHVAPQVALRQGGAAYHEWFVDFDEAPGDVPAFAKTLDTELRGRNIYYEDLRAGEVLAQARIRVTARGAFRSYMDARGKLGGQNKVPRLSNDRAVAEVLLLA